MKLYTGIVALVGLSGACWGQTGTEIAEQVVEHYKSLDGASVTFALEFDAGDSPMAAMLEAMSTASKGYAVRPNLFAFWPDEAQGGGGMMQMPRPHIHCDGSQMITALPSEGTYAIDDAPEGLGNLGMEPGAMMPTSAVQMIPGVDVFLKMMAADASDSIGQMLSTAEFLGKQESDDGAYYAFLAGPDAPMSDGTPVEVHIAAEGDPWVIAMKPDLGEEAAQMGGDISIVMAFRDWKEITEAPAEGKIEIDDEWEKTDDIVEAMLGPMMGGMGGEPSDEMESVDQPAADGEPAPDFSLEELGGGHFQLADYRGKVVVLDFWATWCGPCIRGLPTVTSVTGEYADKGVVFAAVNLEEESDRVSNFMEGKGWDFRVAMDRDGAVAAQYGVTGIPHSVIIDKQGVIRHVEVGFAGAAAAEKMLRDNLDKLIAE